MPYSGCHGRPDSRIGADLSKTCKCAISVWTPLALVPAPKHPVSPRPALGLRPGLPAPGLLAPVSQAL
jgi:hypothetical protein